MDFKYNLLKDALSIKNTTFCRYDSLHGFISEFDTNGDVKGWDIYSNICLYGVWDNILFGTSLDSSCYISRSNNFIAIPAEKYHIIKLTMKLTLPENLHRIPSKGKIMWTTTTDQAWDDYKSIEFDLELTDQWFTYIINVGEAQNWQGDITNLRIYPFIEGKPDINFIIKTIYIDSVNDFICTNTQCSYFTQYSHPCGGTGERSSITSGLPKKFYTTEAGVSDKLIINIDGYGEEQVNLGSYENLDGRDMAKVLVNEISLVSIGQYAYADILYDEIQNRLTIYSGNPTEDAFIIMTGPAAVALGFIDEHGRDISTKTIGKAAASGFDYAASRRLKGFEINTLIDLDVEQTAYYHNPGQYTVEAGRRDFVDSMSSTHIARAIDVDYYELLDGDNKLIIDGSHPVNDSGRLSLVKVNGTRCKDEDTNSRLSSSAFSNYQSKIVLLRPHRDGELEIVEQAVIPDEELGPIYTTTHITYSVEVDWLVNKGDLIGFYNVNVLCPFSNRQQRPNAVYFEVNGLPIGKFSMGAPKAKGVIGISYYARSARKQEDIKLDIDLGRRLNIEELSVHGVELKTYYEYNVASCLDVNWQVDLHNETHWHFVHYCFTGSQVVDRWVEHRNKAYGIEALSDCITTADNGKVGDTYSTNSMGGSAQYITSSKYAYNSDPDTYSGLATMGEHSYFYVNGDAEWLNGGCTVPNPPDANADFWKSEFKSPWTATEPSEYEFDPVTFNLLFPTNKKLAIHKTAMYFKEDNNFKHLSMSYYLGEFGAAGNAEELHYQYVPTFNTVTVDGTILERGKANGALLNERYEELYFSNPWPWAKPKYVNDICVNWDVYQTQMSARMNVLKHEFDPVECYGFRIHNAWHKSTKIIELEVYSSLNIEPSLLDNVTIQHSIYGEDWYDLSFINDPIDSEKIKAHVSGSPRYFRLSIKSQDIFKLKELNGKVSEEHIKALDCGNTITVENAPKGIVTVSKALDLENTYNIPLNLTVDIPKKLFKQKDILSWVRFDSEETALNAEVGPGAIIRKNDDYELYLESGQIANNTPAYYLKNLINNKKSYVFEDENYWSFYKTLNHNEDVDYTNAPQGKASTLGISPISSKYWKLSLCEPSNFAMNNLSVYNSLNSNVTPVNINDDFSLYQDGDYLNSLCWEQQQQIENGKLLISSDGGYSYQTSKFYLEDDFTLSTRFDFKTWQKTATYWEVILRVKSVNDPNKQVQIYISYVYYYSWAVRVYLAYKQNDSWTKLPLVSSVLNDVGVGLKLVRTGNTFEGFSQNFNYSNWITAGSTTYEGFGDKVLVELGVNVFNTNPFTEIYFNFISLTNGYSFVGGLDSTFLIENPINVKNVYIQVQSNEKGGKFKTSIDPQTNQIAPAVLVEDSFDDGQWTNYWNYYLGVTPGSSFVEKSGKIYPFINPQETIYIEKTFNPGAVSFDLEVHFNLDFPTDLVYSIELLNSYNEKVFIMDLYKPVSTDNVGYLLIKTPIPLDQEIMLEANLDIPPYLYDDNFTKTTSTDGFILTMTKNHNVFESITLSNTVGTTNYYNGTNIETFPDRVTKVRISYTNVSSMGIYDQLNNFSTSYIRLRALPRLSDIEAVVFEFNDSQPIDVIKVVQPSGEITYPIISISNNNNDNFVPWARNFLLSDDLIPQNSTRMYSDSKFTHAYLAPWAALKSDSGYWETSMGFEHYWVCDFGAGNEKIINEILYEAYSYYYYSTLTSRDFFKVRIYGSNEYKVTFLKKYNPIIDLKIDLTNATLLGEFPISYSSNNYVIHTFSFFNETAFRYIILHFPETDDGATGSVSARTIQLFRRFSVVTNGAVMINNENYTNYLAIDLEQTHSLDFLRNYGSKSNLLSLYYNTSIVYSNTDTADIDKVDWEEGVPVLLLNFEDYVDSSSSGHYVTVEGSTTLYTTDSPVLPNGHVGLTGGTLSISASQDFNFEDADFTIDFRIKRTRTGNEGVFGRIGSLNIYSSFSFTFNSDNRLVVTLYKGSGLFELKSILALSNATWYHIALVRCSSTVALYVDGFLQDSFNIGVGNSINDTSNPLVIGKVDFYSFVGYLDELRIIKGEAFWKHNFTPPEESYTASIIGDKTKARWLKIPFICGDGVTRNLQYVGIYPDITISHNLSGQFNCEWEPVGNRISNYDIYARNLSIQSIAMSTSALSYNFEGPDLSEWTNLISNTSSGVVQTDFIDEYPDSIWASYEDNLTSSSSYIIHEQGLKIYLSSSEAGNCFFETPVMSGDCTCEINFEHAVNLQKTGSMETRLFMYKSDDSYSISVARRIGTLFNADPIVQVLTDSTSIGLTAFTGSTIANITKFRIEKQDINVTISYYNAITNTWVYTIANQAYVNTNFENTDVYFRLYIAKNSTFPEDTAYINYIRLTEYDNLVDKEVVWQKELYDEIYSGLSCGTTDVPVDLGPLLSPEVMNLGKKIQSFGFSYYNRGQGGGGFSILDSNNEEVLGVATFSPAWKVKSKIGWTTINSSPTSGNNHWYSIKINFDWSFYNAEIIWTDFSSGESVTSVVGLIKQTNVKSFQFRSTLGKVWGPDFTDILLDDITIAAELDWMRDWYPSNCLSGDSSLQGFNYCWGFSAANPKPTLVVDLRGQYRVDRFKLIHYPADIETSWLNTAYTISTATSISGSFSPVYTKTGNTTSENDIILSESVECSFVKLEIDAYTKPANPPVITVYNLEGEAESITIDGGFLREFEIWLSSEKNYLNSQDHPIVCMDLKSQFKLAAHDLICPWPGSGQESLDWSNDNSFFQYSDNISNNPQQVAFIPPTEYAVPFSYVEELLDNNFTGGPYLLASEIFLSKGRYQGIWKTYGAVEYGYVSLKLKGPQLLVLTSSNRGEGWVQQTSNFDILETGYYSIQAEATPLDISSSWGVKEIYFSNIQTTSKWIAVRRNTAENFSTNPADPITPIGIDYLERLKVFSSERLRPTEFSWWWSSFFSILENDAVNTKVGKCSLKISYPASDEEDQVKFIEGDCFGNDTKFSIKDALSFWMYVSDINKLDVDHGGIIFGSFEGYSDDHYDSNRIHTSGNKRAYKTFIGWNFSSMSLVSGWNQVKLCFDRYDNIYPEPDELTGNLDIELNYRYSATSSFGMVFKGKGQSFFMLLDGLKFERNRFLDEVIYGDKGLCLTWNEYAEIPLSSANVYKGTIEAWIKLYSSTAGMDHYGDVTSKTIFTLVNNNNDCITLSLRGAAWFEIGFGNTKSGYNISYVNTNLEEIGDYAFPIDSVIHVALVWSNDGLELGNNETVRLYINGVLCLASLAKWEVSDNKGVLLRLGGGNTYLANNDDDDGSVIFSNVKFYNFCKTSFDLAQQYPKIIDTVSPNDFVQISKDNITFHDTNSTGLPLVFEAVAPGDKVTIYTRVDKTKMHLLDKVTGNINIDWEVPV